MPAKRAFSLLELTVAVGLLAIILVSVIELFVALLGSTTKGSNLTAGTYFAQRCMEEAIRLNQYAAAGSASAAGLYTTDKNTQTTFWHKVSSTPIVAQAGKFSGGYLITVDVWWWSDAPGQSRTNQGRLSTRLQRFHYPQGVPVTP